MNTTIIPEIFARYKQAKYDRFIKWLGTKHGQTVYTLFKRFSQMYRNAGHDRCGANLIGNRIRWEMLLANRLAQHDARKERERIKVDQRLSGETPIGKPSKRHAGRGLNRQTFQRTVYASPQESRPNDARLVSRPGATSTGWDLLTHWVPPKGFQDVVVTSLVPSQASPGAMTPFMLPPPLPYLGPRHCLSKALYAILRYPRTGNIDFL
jgi:hypothetical protein